MNKTIHSYTFFLLGFFWLLFYHPAPAQAPTHDAWAKATRGLDYSKDLPDPPQKRRALPDMPISNDSAPSFSPFWANFWQLAAIGAGILIVAYGLYRMLLAQSNKLPQDATVQITLENLEQHLHESDLERFLRDAKSNGAFSQAIRIYYLMTIKKLAEKKVITWSPDKTNRTYQRELQNAPYLPEFKWATRQYEAVWFSNKALQVSEFQSLEPLFQQLIQKI
ncbi:MAG: DUF4129 domain-containing protein [Bacteroidetes bacterium]|nr:DUF4129 domain-containing protein [Bacteroidota bacterium]